MYQFVITFSRPPDTSSAYRTSLLACRNERCQLQLDQRRSAAQRALRTRCSAAIRTCCWAVARRQRLPGSAPEDFELRLHEAANQVIRQRFAGWEVQRALRA